MSPVLPCRGFLQSGGGSHVERMRGIGDMQNLQLSYFLFFLFSTTGSVGSATISQLRPFYRSIIRQGMIPTRSPGSYDVRLASKPRGDIAETLASPISSESEFYVFEGKK